jgi:hypothetical protein
MGVSVIQKFAAVLTAATLAVGGVALASPAGAADEPYQARMKTRTTVTVPVQVDPGTFIPTRVVVNPNGVVPKVAAGSKAAAAPAVIGRIRLTYTRVDGGFRATMVKAYNGSPIRFPGPQLNPLGRYTVSAVYVPAPDSIYRGSSDTDNSRILEGDEPNPQPPAPDGGENPDGDNPGGGLLPDTGGPDLGLLLLGLTLVAGGTGLVVAARDRRKSAYLV